MDYGPNITARTNDLSRVVVDSAYKVHKALGPGLLESVDRLCLRHDLAKRGVPIRTEVPVPIIFDDLTLDSGLRLDLLVDNSIVVELKAVEKVLPVHEAQILSYMKLTNTALGLLINFNVPTIKQGIKRFAL